MCDTVHARSYNAIIFLYLTGIQGFTMKIDKNGDSETNYTIMALSKSQPQVISEVGKFSYDTGDSSSNNDTGNSIPVSGE